MTETNFQANPAQSGELPAGVDIRSLDKFLEWRASEGPKIAESEKRMASDAMRRAAGETPIERGLHEFLDFDAQRIATEGALALGPLLFGAALYKASPAEIRAGLAAASGLGIVVGFGTEAAAFTVARAEVGHPRLVDLAKALAASHVGLRVAEISAWAGIGMVAVAMGEKIIQSIHPAVQAVTSQPTSSSGPEATPVPQPGEDGGAPGGGTGETGAGTDTTGGGPVGSGEPGPTLLPEDLAATAEEAAEAARVATQQAAIEATQAPLEMLGRDLAGGDIWSQALKTAGELGVRHVVPVANLIKNLDYVFEQAQSFRHIGPEDMVNLVNPKLAAWVGQELDKIVGMDPSTLTGYKRLLWDIGVSARHAVPADLEELSKAFVEATTH